MDPGQKHTAIDFFEIVENVQSFQSPLDKSTHEVDFQGNISETCEALKTAICDANQDPQQCVFYMNPDSVDWLARENSNVAKAIEQGGKPEFLGRPIKIDPSMALNTMLFMSPDAVSLGGTINNPEMIAWVHWNYSDRKSNQ